MAVNNDGKLGHKDSKEKKIGKTAEKKDAAAVRTEKLNRRCARQGYAKTY